MARRTVLFCAPSLAATHMEVSREVLLPSRRMVLVLNLIPAVAGTKPWTLDDILAVRTVSDPQVSPDGRWVAYVVQELKADGSDYQSDV